MRSGADLEVVARFGRAAEEAYSGGDAHMRRDGDVVAVGAQRTTGGEGNWMEERRKGSELVAL